MAKYGLSRAEVCDVLNLAITKDGQTPAVNKWLAKDDNNFRSMPDTQIELLELRLGERKVELWKRNAE